MLQSNPCDRKFRNKHSIIKMTVDMLKESNSQYMNKAKMFELLAKMAETSEQYYDNEIIHVSSFAKMLDKFFNKDELCLILDSLYYEGTISESE